VGYWRTWPNGSDILGPAHPMGKIVAHLSAFALALGAPGLVLVSFIDSSFLSLPEVVDLLVVAMVTGHNTLLPLYVASATLGSVAGCLVIYSIGRKGGEVLVRKRFSTGSSDRALAALRRHGMLAVVVPALMPPPMPFKLFVLLAGVAEITPVRFVLAVVIGRGGRFLVLGILALRYGERTLAYLRGHTTESVVAAAVLLLGTIAWLLAGRLRRTTGDA
jgi:membrane protein YqaA with SNARE-associated domain